MDKAGVARERKQSEESGKRTRPTIRRRTHLRTPLPKCKCEIVIPLKPLKIATCRPIMTSSVTLKPGCDLNIQNQNKRIFSGIPDRKKQRHQEKCKNLASPGETQVKFSEHPQALPHTRRGNLLLSASTPRTVVSDSFRKPKVNDIHFMLLKTDPLAIKMEDHGRKPVNYGQDDPKTGYNRKNKTECVHISTRRENKCRFATQENTNNMAKKNDSHGKQIKDTKKGIAVESVRNICGKVPSCGSGSQFQSMHLSAPTDSSLIQCSNTTDYQVNTTSQSHKIERRVSAPGISFISSGQGSSAKLGATSPLTLHVPNITGKPISKPLRVNQSPKKMSFTENSSKFGRHTHFTHNDHNISASLGDSYKFNSMYSHDFTPFKQSISRSRKGKNKAYRQDNTINHDNTYLEQDIFKQVPENRSKSRNKNVSSNENHYSDVENKKSSDNRNTPLDSVLKENECTVDHSYRKSNKSLTCQCSNAPDQCVTTFTKTDKNEDLPEMLKDLVTDSRNTNKKSDQMSPEYSNRSFRYESFLKEILKEVAETISKPSLLTSSAKEPVHLNQLTQTSGIDLSDGNIDKSMKHCDDRFFASSFLKQPNKECTLLNQETRIPSNEIQLKIPEGQSIVIESYEFEKLQYGDNSSIGQNHIGKQNNDPTPEHSTVSLEVKSVNLSFCCSDNQIENSSRQIRIKWAISPDTKAENVVIGGVPDIIDNSLSGLSLKLKSSEINQKTYVQQAVSKNQKPEHDICSPPNASSIECCKRVTTRKSDTTLRSPSPCKTNQCPSKRKNNTSKNHLSAKSYHSHGQQSIEYHCLTLLSKFRVQNQKNFKNKKNTMLSAASKVPCTCVSSDVQYKHKCATKILAKKYNYSLVPRSEDRYILLQLDWGVFIIIVTTIPILLLILSFNFYSRASAITEETAGTKS